MEKPILKIKTSIPPLSPGAIPRPHINEKITPHFQAKEGFSRFLTLVSAPAGYGKTTFIRQLIREKEDRTAWFSLSEEDNEPEHFWFYLISALQKFDGETGKGSKAMLNSNPVNSPLSNDPMTFFTPLLNDLFELEKPVFLVLDDYHLINNLQIHEEMVFFLENLPPTLHLFVTTRSDPPWPLSRWRGKGQIMDIRLKDLRFTEKETKNFLCEKEKQDLSQNQLIALHKKTEGWASGLQLVAHSLASSSDREDFITNFTGTHRHVFYFLSQEVLNKQTAEVRSFLMDISILRRLNPSLCEAVTGREDSNLLLTNFEKNNLFILPLDETGDWFRFHQLFGDLLYHQLKANFPKKIPQLYQRATKWFLDQEEPGEAIRHALAGNDLEGVAEILNSAYGEILQTEEPSLRSRCLEKIPPQILRKYPKLIAHKALFQLVKEGKGGVKESLQMLEEYIRENKTDGDELSGLFATVKTYFHIYSNQFPQALEHAEKALDLLPLDSHYWRMSLEVFLGDSLLLSGKPREAYMHYLKAHQINEERGNNYLLLSTGIKIINTHLSLGEIREAEKIATDLLKFAQGNGVSRIPRAGTLWVLLGEIKREQGDLSEAQRCMERGLFISQKEVPTYAWNLLFKVGLLFSQKHFAEALSTAEKIQKMSRKYQLPLFISFPAKIWQARILLTLGEEKKAEEILAGESITPQENLQKGKENGFLNLCRKLVTQEKIGGENSPTKRLLESLEKQATKNKDKALFLETRVLIAKLEEKTKNPEKAKRTLISTLKEGKENGFFQLFVDQGPLLLSPVLKVLDDVKQKNPELENYLQNILQAISPEKTTQKESLSLKKSSSTEKLVENLTEKEIEVLQLISKGFSNQEIARELFLSPNTVKWYNSNIFGKLGVNRRTHAVAEARRLNILS